MFFQECRKSWIISISDLCLTVIIIATPCLQLWKINGPRFWGETMQTYSNEGILLHQSWALLLLWKEGDNNNAVKEW